MRFAIHLKTKTGKFWEWYDRDDVYDLASARRVGRMINKKLNKKMHPPENWHTFLSAKLG
jgi:hypothetical protein